MRLVLITVSAVALTGCTWFGGGNAQSGSQFFNGQSAANCIPQAGFGQAFQGQGFQGQGFQGQGFQGGFGGCPAGTYSVNGGQGAGFGQAASARQALA